MLKTVVNLVSALCITYTLADIVASIVIFKKIRQGKIRIYR